MKTRGLRVLPIILLSLFMTMVVMGEEKSRHLREQTSNALNSLISRADEGDAKALYDLAMLYDTGFDSIPVDSAMSSMLYKISAEKGYAPAQNYLGFRYFNGEYLKQNVDSGLYWLAKAAGNGDFKAAGNLGFLLSNSNAVSRDYPQAIMWLSRASDAGLPTAQSLLADLFRQGLGTEADTLKAISLYTSAIEGGLQDAELKLLNMMGRSWENLSADSALILGRYYYNHRAPLIGVTLFGNAEKLGNTEAMSLLGDAYSRALGVEYDHNKSLYFFLKGALGGEPSAQFVIGELLDLFPDAFDEEGATGLLEEYFGNELPEGIDKAQYWYEKAAQQGITDAEAAYINLLKSDTL